MTERTIWRLPIGIVAAAIALGVPYVVSVAWGRVFLLTMLVSLLMAVGIWLRGERRLSILCDPMVLFCAFLSQFFVIGALCLSLFGLRVLNYPITQEQMQVTLVAFVVFLACFILGYQSRIGVMLSDALPDFSGGRLKLPGRWVESLILGGSVLGCLLYVWDLGGLRVIFGSSYGHKAYSSFYLLAFYGLIIGALLMGWRLLSTQRRSGGDLVVFALLLVGEILFFAFFLGARSRLFLLFFGLFSIWVLRRGPSRSLLAWAAVLMVILLVFFSVWGTVRGVPLSDLAEGSWDPRYAQEPLYHGYFSSVAEPFAVACMVMDLFPDTEPYRYGQTLLVTVLGFIPRDVWPDKPIGLGKDLTRYTDGVFYEPRYGHSITATILGDCYANLGWFGAILGGFLLGLVYRSVAAYAAKGMENRIQRSAGRVLITAVFIAGMIQLRSDTAMMLAFYGMVYPFLLFALMFFRLDYEDPVHSVSRLESARSAVAGSGLGGSP